jgi:hypothetical protein
MTDEVERIWQEFVVLLQRAWRDAYSVSAGFQVSWWWFM